MANYRNITPFAAGTVETANFTSLGFATEEFTHLTVQVNVSALSGTSPSLLVFIDISCDNGATWTQVAQGAAAITAVGSQAISVGPGMTNTSGLGNQARVRGTVTGTTPSFTLGVTGTLKG